MTIKMDTAQTFRPHTILLWRKVERDAEARRIIEMFPEARVRIVERQRPVAIPGRSRDRAVVAGKRVLMIGETSSFAKHFDGCLGSGVLCYPYAKLVPISNGCPYYCTYCYLAQVYRDYLPAIKMNVNHDRMFREIRRTITKAGGAVAFNMGEMLDSLALDHVSLLTQRLVPFFAGLSRGYLMLLTKSANIEGLLGVEPHRGVVVSWSLNSERMIEAYEVGTASLDERIEAARRCQKHGYRIRLRIDPGILSGAWRHDYAELIRKSLTVLEPENITLGMLRLLPGHFRLAASAYGRRGAGLQNEGLACRAADGKLRYAPQQRVEFYRFLIDSIRSFNEHVSISLCRETPDVWRHLANRCDHGKCNCLIW
jgi:spore photoproduct lyase